MAAKIQKSKKTYKMTNGMLAYVSAARKKVVANAAKTKECPKCKRTREFKFFGVRTHKDETGKPNRFSPQSYCVDCRSGKVVKAKKPAKVKGKVTAKATAKKEPVEAAAPVPPTVTETPEMPPETLTPSQLAEDAAPKTE